jgi:DNA-binding protein HU-beta
MNKGHLVDRIAGSSKCSKTQAAAAIDTMIDGVTAALKKGERVTLVGFARGERMNIYTWPNRIRM